MSIPSMPLFCGDYLKDTTDLTLEEHGAYLMILMITWATGGKALPDNDARMAKRLSITKDRWVNKLKPVLAQFFDLSGGTWRNERLEREWNYVQGVIAKRREAGAMGGRPTKSGPQDGPGNSHFSDASVHCNLTESCDANSLKSNETSKANGSSLLKQTESTHPHTSAYAETEEDEDAGARAVVIHVAQQVAAMAGFVGPVDKRPDLDIVAGWLKEGADPDVDIIPAVAIAMNRTTQVRIRTFGYFTDEVRQHHAARINPPQEPSNVLPYRSPAQQHRRHSGRPTGGRAQISLVAREFKIGDFDADGSGVWAG